MPFGGSFPVSVPLKVAQISVRSKFNHVARSCIQKTLNETGAVRELERHIDTFKKMMTESKMR